MCSSDLLSPSAHIGRSQPVNLIQNFPPPTTQTLTLPSPPRPTVRAADLDSGRLTWRRGPRQRPSDQVARTRAEQRSPIHHAGPHLLPHGGATSLPRRSAPSALGSWPLPRHRAAGWYVPDCSDILFIFQGIGIVFMPLIYGILLGQVWPPGCPSSSRLRSSASAR